MSDFTFRRFAVAQDRCAMKVGTDGVLLGAWADVHSSSRILDLGTGTGLVALMAAQRAPEASVTAVELDSAAAGQAAENFAASPFGGRLVAICCDAAKFTADLPFDHIISNPPFFFSELKSPDAARSLARHVGGMSPETIGACADRLLTPVGRLSIIIPASDEGRWWQGLAAGGFSPRRICRVKTTLKKPPRRTLMEFGRGAGECVFDEIMIGGERFKQLTSEFYL